MILILAQHINNKDTKDVNKIKIDGYIYEVPYFLISKKIPKNYTNILIRKSLYFTRQVYKINSLFPTIYCFQNLVLF